MFNFDFGQFDFGQLARPLNFFFMAASPVSFSLEPCCDPKKCESVEANSPKHRLHGSSKVWSLSFCSATIESTEFGKIDGPTAVYKTSRTSRRPMSALLWGDRHTVLLLLSMPPSASIGPPLFWVARRCQLSRSVTLSHHCIFPREQSMSDVCTVYNVSLQLGYQPRPGAVFFEECTFSVIDAGTSTIRAASRCRIRQPCMDADVLHHLDGICSNLMTAVVHLCHHRWLHPLGRWRCPLDIDTERMEAKLLTIASPLANCCSLLVEHQYLRSASEMRPSQVTCVTQASGTFNRALSPHRTCVALVHILMYKGLVQHTLQKCASGLWVWCRVFLEGCHGTRALYNRIDAIEQTNFRVNEACTTWNFDFDMSGSSHAV